MNEYICSICPRNCRAVRSSDTGEGVCSSGTLPRIARAALHFGEEPCISGTRGSGTVFFTGCNLHCVYCQNEEISREGSDAGKTVSIERLREIFKELRDQGAHNINLVTGAHYITAISKALEKDPGIPVVYNSGGYEKPESLRLLKGKVNIFLPDFKYALSSVAEKYSCAPDYPKVALAAIKEMYDQVGPVEIDDEGILKKGVLIRHLILPNNVFNTLRVMDLIEENFDPSTIMFSLMSQYTPMEGVPAELSRPVSEEEYGICEQYLLESSLENGFLQDLSSATEEMIPKFDLTGV
ncbi:MAG: radical SAM protein [Clostridia bacterium]|nr:radical SAM protein [Clostridia bacterium]